MFKFIFEQFGWFLKFEYYAKVLKHKYLKWALCEASARSTLCPSHTIPKMHLYEKKGTSGHRKCIEGIRA